LFAKREDLKKFAANVADEFQKTNSRSFSVALCFDALLTVLDNRRRKGTPSIADEVKELLSRLPKQAEPKQEEPKDANPPSNE
jgi:hypothetical protein